MRKPGHYEVVYEITVTPTPVPKWKSIDRKKMRCAK